MSDVQGVQMRSPAARLSFVTSLIVIVVAAIGIGGCGTYKVFSCSVEYNGPTGTVPMAQVSGQWVLSLIGTEDTENANSEKSAETNCEDFVGRSLGAGLSTSSVNCLCTVSNSGGSPVNVAAPSPVKG